MTKKFLSNTDAHGCTQMITDRLFVCFYILMLGEFDVKDNLSFAKPK